VGEDYDGQIGHRYFDTVRYPAKLICDIDCDGLLIEYDMTPNYEGLLGIKQLFVGAADVQDMHVEKPETIVERITQYGWLAPEQTLITSTCGMNHLSRDIAFGKLKAMAGGQTDSRRLKLNRSGMSYSIIRSISERRRLRVPHT
jgi:5-methyltetrahydropteroyltriglutamate--homocysteine methyltransferase